MLYFINGCQVHLNYNQKLRSKVNKDDLDKFPLNFLSKKKAQQNNWFYSFFRVSHDHVVDKSLVTCHVDSPVTHTNIHAKTGVKRHRAFCKYHVNIWSMIHVTRWVKSTCSRLQSLQ